MQMGLLGPASGVRPIAEWPADDAIVLVVTDGSGYNAAVRRVAYTLASRLDGGVFLTANRPTETLRPAFEEAGISLRGIHFLDCVSSLTGIAPVASPQTVFIESPTLLEKMFMRADQVLRRQPGPRRFFIVDSLSSLAVYNGAQPVMEMMHALVGRLRLQRIGAAFLLVERQSDGALRDALSPLCDAVVRLDASQG